MSRANASSRASSVMISRGRMSFSHRYIIWRAAWRANSSRRGSVARMVPFPGKAIPRTSQIEFILFAVKRPEQEPHPGQAYRSNVYSSSSSMSPALYAPTPSNTVMRSATRPSGRRPAAIGPPETKMVGMFSRMAAISIPGVILSQLGMQIMASNWWASIMVSTLSAMSSRLGSEYFMPKCPIAIPSSMPMVLNIKGTPPASRTASLTISPNSFK